MEIKVSSLEKIKIIHILGELNSVTSVEAEQKIIQFIVGGNQNLLIDFSNLQYISSAGLRIFLVANKLIKKNGTGSISFCNLTGTVKEVFEISGFQKIFRCFADIEAAKSQLQ